MSRGKTLTPPERIAALREALRRAQTVGPVSIPVIAGMAGGLAVSIAVDWILYPVMVAPWRQFVDAAAFAIIAAPVWLLVQRREVRHAIEVITWLNGWETERWQREIGHRLPGLPRATPQLLDALPDTMGLRPLRIELLAVRGELDEAYDRVERLPADTPWQRFERAALAEWVSFVSNGRTRIDEMEAALPELDDERALVGRAMIAAARSRRAAVEGRDAIGPLASVRSALGARPARYAFPYRTGIILSVLTIALIASFAVTVTATLIR